MRDTVATRALSRCALFSHASDVDLGAMIDSFVHRRFRRDEVIFHQGDPGQSLHIISEGAVKIVLASPVGGEAIIATLRSGDFFGELALLDGEARSTSAIAVEPTETLSLRRETFRDMLGRDIALRDAFHAGVAHELRRLTNQVEELHFLDLPGRLASHLLRMADGLEARADGVVLDWPYTQRELASMIGGTRQSVNRLLGDLIDRGLLRIEHNRLLIPDLDALRRESDR